MKITIEPTESVGTNPETTNVDVSVSFPSDDLTVTDVIDHLIVPALVAYGFAKESVIKAIVCEEKTPS